METNELFGKLKPNPNNPRILRDDQYKQLKEKIRKFPQMLEKRPIVYDENFMILGGNMRFRVLQELQKEGMEIKDTYLASCEGWTDEEKRQFVISDNISDGEWNYDMLANEWDVTELKDWGLNLPYLGEVQNIEKIHGEDTEWVGMPEFEPADAPPKIVINFDSEELRDEFVKATGLKIGIKLSKTWSTWIPYREKEDIASLKYE